MKNIYFASLLLSALMMTACSGLQQNVSTASNTQSTPTSSAPSSNAPGTSAPSTGTASTGSTTSSSAPTSSAPVTSSPAPTNPAPANPAPTPSPTPDPAPTPAPSSPVSAPSGAITLSKIQSSSGWNSWGQFAPDYQDCNAPCPGLSWTITPGINTPSLSGNATEFSIAGITPYADVLFSDPLIGQFSTQGLPDKDHSLLPTIHHFIYDADFYVTNAAVTQVMEFDVSMYMNGASMIWGNQCNNLGDHDWDIWDNAHSKWVSTGVPCSFIDQGWNHVTLELERQDDNTLIYHSFTLNGVTANLETSYAPSTVPMSWWGITVNYQMDGDSKESSNTTYLDNFSLTYW